MDPIHPWLIVLVIASAGAIGGVFNALLTDNGFVMPCKEEVGHFRIVRPGVLGNALIGSCAAVVAWGLYGPANDLTLLGKVAGDIAVARQPSLVAGEFASALILGVAGARWLTSEVDKRLLHAAAATAAGADASPDAAHQIAAAAPAQAVGVAKAMATPAGPWRAARGSEARG